jgi:EAL domain-containing protein (putative c-di-GMP-specific phosphodiesterase class I)
MRDADTALYRAKRQGGAQYVVFDGSMHERALMVLRTTWELRAALEKREFELHLSAACKLERCIDLWVEALIRWNHPARGVLGPDEFIPLVEEIGLIKTIEHWVIQQASHDLSTMKESYGRDLLLSVNV